MGVAGAREGPAACEGETGLTRAGAGLRWEGRPGSPGAESTSRPGSSGGSTQTLATHTRPVAVHAPRFSEHVCTWPSSPRRPPKERHVLHVRTRPGLHSATRASPAWPRCWAGVCPSSFTVSAVRPSPTPASFHQTSLHSVVLPPFVLDDRQPQQHLISLFPFKSVYIPLPVCPPPCCNKSPPSVSGCVGLAL